IVMSLTPASLAASITWISSRFRASRSACTTRPPSGFSDRSRSISARTAVISTGEPSIQISLFGVIATKILAASGVNAVDASGLVTSTPGSLTNTAVTMKKMSMMNTTSSIGVRLISLSSSSMYASLSCIVRSLLEAGRSVDALGQRDVVDPGRARRVHHADQRASRRVGRRLNDDRAIRVLRVQALDDRAHRANVDLLIVDPDPVLVVDDHEDRAPLLNDLGLILVRAVRVDARLPNEAGGDDEEDQHDE